MSRSPSERATGSWASLTDVSSSFRVNVPPMLLRENHHVCGNMSNTDITSQHLQPLHWCICGAHYREKPCCHDHPAIRQLRERRNPWCRSRYHRIEPLQVSAAATSLCACERAVPGLCLRWKHCYRDPCDPVYQTVGLSFTVCSRQGLNVRPCRSCLTVITACGAHNFDLVESYGADACFDYKDPECGKKVREYTGGKIAYVYDTSSTEPWEAVCAEAMSSA